MNKTDTQLVAEGMAVTGVAGAIIQLDKLDTQWISGQISEGERNAQRLVVLLNLVIAQG